jgi:hypothetical protein
MCGPYWSQFSHGELMSMQGVEIDDPEYNDDTNLEHDEDDTNMEQEDCCPRCSGGGCNYCLMTSY